MSLYLIAFIGGALTLLSPCILPVLPFVFARSGKPFTRGSLPLLAGMALAFAAVASLAGAAGEWAVRANQWGRAAALAAMAVFALSLLLPRVAALWTRPLVRIGERLSSTPGRDGRGASFVLGMATGLLWSPCAGPILGLVLTGAALGGPGVHTSALLLAYGAGAALSLALLLRAGEGTLRALKARPGSGEGARRALGAAVLAGVVAVGAGLDTGVLARWSVDLTAGLEQGLINALVPSAQAQPAASAQAPVRSRLPVEQERPELGGAVQWLNSPPLSLEALRGKVVLVNFWTYSCINCLRTLPYVRAWAEKYAAQGLVVIGVHTPEFAFEKDPDNVRRAVKDLKVPYPVALDNRFSVWRSFRNQYWPALYFLDAQGRVRHHQFGEGGHARSEQVIQELLRDAGAGAAEGQGAAAVPQAVGVGLPSDPSAVGSPETYIGYQHADAFASPGRIAPDRIKTYAPGRPGLNEWGLSGDWIVRQEFAESARADGAIVLRFRARDAHLVLGTAQAGTPVRFRLTLDGRPPGEDHGDDVNAAGEGVIDGARLYQLVRQKGRVGERTVEIRFLDAGARAFAFTFG